MAREARCGGSGPAVDARGRNGGWVMTDDHVTVRRCIGCRWPWVLVWRAGGCEAAGGHRGWPRGARHRPAVVASEGATGVSSGGCQRGTPVAWVLGSGPAAQTVDTLELLLLLKRHISINDNNNGSQRFVRLLRACSCAGVVCCVEARGVGAFAGRSGRDVQLQMAATGCCQRVWTTGGRRSVGSWGRRAVGVRRILDGCGRRRRFRRAAGHSGCGG